MSNIHWAGTANIATLPIFIFGILLVLFRSYRIINSLRQLTTKHQILMHGIGSKRTIAKTACMILALIALFIALLRPQWGKQEETVIQSGRDVLILLDVSGSMRAKDLKPDRLTIAKLKVRTLLQKLTCERVGLILFSGTAFLQCPMTADHAAFLLFLENVDAESISSGTTALDTALKKAIETFKKAGERKNKLIVLLTDGEDFSTNFSATQQRAEREGVSLFALGIGTPEGAPIPKLNPQGKQIGHELDETGAVALSRLNEEKLIQITTALRGGYCRAHYDDADVQEVIAFVQQHEKEQYHDKKLERYHDRYPWFLGATWLLLALEWIL
jgi:Ca-activated chloride channel family protein